MKEEKEKKDEIRRIVDNEDYDLLLWERETKEDYVRINYEQPDYYVNEEESYCILSFYQKINNKEVLKGVELEGSVDIYCDIKEEVIEFVGNLLKKLKENLINPADYELENK